jgi:glutathione synthase/RimK-type ligase-like ATP-grasp enzyme
VRRVINTVAGEQATLKTWLARFNRTALRVIPTHRLEPRSSAAMHRRLASLQVRYGALVVKPNWGGAGQQVVRLDSTASIRAFVERADTHPAHPLDTLCVQPHVEGPEKRLWFVGDTCVEGRIIENRPRPWDPVGARSTRIARYFYPERLPSNATTGARTPAGRFARDLGTAQAVWRCAGLEIGSVDFIGDQVNELNGCGTTFTQYDRWRCVTDARPQLVRWLRDQVRSTA